MVEWKPVVGYEDSYEVSSAGDVRSVPRTVYFADGRVRPYAGKELAQYEDGAGYKKVTLKRQDAGLRVHVHVLVAAAFIGQRPAGQHVCHEDGNAGHAVSGNLRYDTVKGNHADKRRHGTHLQGASAPSAKLDEQTVRAIRRMRGVLTGQQLAERFGTSRTNVCNIQLRRRWAHLT